MSAKQRSLAALLLLVPAPTIGVLAAIVWAPGPRGQAVYSISKAWILLLPLLWLWFVERRPIEVTSPARAKGFGMAFGLGVLIAAIIIGGYLVIGTQWIDTAAVHAIAEQNGLTKAWKYLALAGYLCIINSLLEEYVWRWFVFHHCAVLVPRWPAVLLSALFFTIHHVFALGFQFDWRITLLGSVGVFIGGVVWSWLYLRFGTVWPGWVSHLIVDLAVFAVGWMILFPA